MEDADNPPPEQMMQTLREGIKSKYEEYNRQDEKRFPPLEYNTNRANYEALRLSFEEEFYVIRGVDRGKNTIHIPSTKTFAAIFCDENYVPGKKILNTCHSYAEGFSQLVPGESASVPRRVMVRKINRRLLIVGILVLVSAISYLIVNSLQAPPPASGLVMHRPQKKQVVGRKSLVEGSVSNADTIWVVVRPQQKEEYYFQPPIKVKSDGTWTGEIYVGSVGKETTGLTFEVRAFVRPVGAPESLEVIESIVPDSWPEAELSSPIVEVVRGVEKE